MSAVSIQHYKITRGYPKITNVSCLESYYRIYYYFYSQCYKNISYVFPFRKYSWPNYYSSYIQADANIQNVTLPLTNSSNLTNLTHLTNLTNSSVPGSARLTNSSSMNISSAVNFSSGSANSSTGIPSNIYNYSNSSNTTHSSNVNISTSPEIMAPKSAPLSNF